MDKFKVTTTEIEGVLIIEPILHSDNRGYFVKTFDEEEFEKKGLDIKFVQEDQSCSAKGVLRGLHFQIEHPQGKLLRALRGKIFDVGVDLRKDSKTYGEWIGVILSEKNQKQLFLPKGFAHGFLSLEDHSIILYKVDDIHYPDDEGGLLYNDKDIGIEWPFEKVDEIVMKDKDKTWKTLKESNITFKV